ncbi:MAG: carboxylesterase/lipase family protein [Myxococcota bacterium]
MPAPNATTSLGCVRGVALGGVDAFLGIPYAAPPIGALRFEPPHAPAPWSGVREATAHGPAPLQPRDGLSFQLGLLAEHPQSEDCLTLNVWRPAAPGRELRAVMVWLHGGAFTSGSAAGPAYQGAALARRGDVIVVSLNYRVGALGFLALGPGHTNLGLLDQIAALRFVQREIAAFGGDPARVTVFGESAGAGSIVALLAMPAARGSFARAIVQSAAPEGQLGLDEAAARARRLGEELGGDVRDLAWLRSLPAERLIAAQAQCAEPGPRRIGMYFAPVVGDATLPEPPLRAIAAGSARDVALVIGTTTEEMRLFQLVPGMGALSEAALPSFVASKLSGNPEARRAAAHRIVAQYPGASAQDRFFALETDASLFVPSARLAEAQARVRPDTWMYRFAWRSPHSDGALGACHALDVPFALGTLEDSAELRAFAGSGAAALRVAHAVMDAWSGFARSGDPSCANAGPWPRYDAERRATLELGDPSRIVLAPDESRRALWADALYPEISR